MRRSIITRVLTSALFLALIMFSLFAEKHPTSHFSENQLLQIRISASARLLGP